MTRALARATKREQQGTKVTANFYFSSNDSVERSEQQAIQRMAVQIKFDYLLRRLPTGRLNFYFSSNDYK